MSTEKPVMPISEIRAQIQRATDTFARLNAFEESLDAEGGLHSAAHILEKYREARYGR